MSHNVDELTEQAQHLARLQIADRCKRDLYYLCRYILGYEAMTDKTHGELCQVTQALLGHDNNKSQELTDRESVAQYTFDDLASEHSTPHSTPESAPVAGSNHLNSPDNMPPEIFSPEYESLSQAISVKNPGVIPQTVDSADSDGKIEANAEGAKPQFLEPASDGQNDSEIPETIENSEEINQTIANIEKINPLAEPLVPENTALYNPFPGNESDIQFDPDKRALHIEMPRGTFKSSVVTIGFALQFILNDPNGRVLIDSETYSKAKNFLAEVKGHLEKNHAFRTVYYTIYGVYPDEYRKNASVRWKDNEVDLSCRTKETKEASFTVSGIDKSINGMHFDLIIGDDLHSETNVTNREQIEKVVQHYKLLLSLLDPGRYLIIIGTRWHYNDMYQYLFDYESFRFNFYVRRAKNKDGTLLFPERLSEQFLLEQRKSQGSYLFSCQYFNQPVDDEDATFKRSSIITRPWEVISAIPINWYMSVDPSSKAEQSTQSDYAALVVAGLDALSNLYVRHVTRRKMGYGEIIEEMFVLYLKYRPKEIVVETIASANAIQYMLTQEMQRRGIILPIKYISGRNTNKEVRIEALEPYYSYGRAIHVSECPQREDLEDELIAFPKGANDDAIDSLASILEIAKPAKPVRDPEEARERKAKMNKFTKPRSPMTRV